MLEERIQSTPILPVRLRLKTNSEFRLPIYKGSVFRGGFGQIFRDVCCITRAPNCDGCPHTASCGYSQVFESPIAGSDLPLLTKYTNAPHPFVLSPPLDQRTRVPARSDLNVDLTMLQPAVAWFPHFLFVFDRLGQEGRYGGPYSIENATSLVDGSVIFDGRARRILKDPVPLDWANSSPAETTRLKIEFLTPLRMRTDGRYNNSPDFRDFIHGLLGRLHLLTAIYGGQSAGREWMRDLLALADKVKTTSREYEVFRWDRTSGRQGRRIPMDGVVGWMEAEGELTPFLPALRAGEFLHAGSGTSSGLGKFRTWTRA